MSPGPRGQGLGLKVRIFIFKNQMGVLDSSKRKHFLAWGGMWEERPGALRTASGGIFVKEVEPGGMDGQG